MPEFRGFDDRLVNEPVFDDNGQIRPEWLALRDQMVRENKMDRDRPTTDEQTDSRRLSRP